MFSFKKRTRSMLFIAGVLVILGGSVGCSFLPVLPDYKGESLFQPTVVDRAQSRGIEGALFSFSKIADANNE